ncbi:DUF4424 family protein [Pseudoduganella armeniaca]|uniref:Uncharacterized protein n=1 Tax=Pseudoduganella armeniaca TaxID=2072590 RepID=A0A2R4CAE5_9BURK|nr:DUF4424 family protein [Pseudoduganella armeniaca]AVR96468.1 hypothetical protein C9I28_12740 [Pseudoduganella armeniaca]
MRTGAGLLAGAMAAAACPLAAGYENELGVPLSLAADIGPLALQRSAVRLDGRAVTITNVLRNESAAAQTAAFYASTPIFGRLGIAEEHDDKRFAELAVLVQGRPARLRRAAATYFDGRDITRQLAHAGIDPLHPDQPTSRPLARLPSRVADNAERWRSAVTYSWHTTLAAGATSVQEIRYRAIPRFGLQMTASPELDRQVAQFCGDPATVRRAIDASDPGAEVVMVERYDIPLDDSMLRDVDITVSQPARNWLGARPLLTLACGLATQDGGKLAGTMAPVDATLGFLVISAIGPVEAHATVVGD